MGRVGVNPEILRWARETAGLQPETAARKIQLGATKSMTPVERLRQLESGETEPTRALLVKMAKQYKRPLVAFYLSDIPKRSDRGNDFRTLPVGYARTDDAYLDVLIRRIGARQSLLRAALEDEDEADKLPFVGSKSMSDGVQDVVASIRQTIPITLEEFRRKRNAREAFKKLRRAVESIGVFVILAGNLGSHHTTIDVRTFRGFALSDPVAPFVVINSQDARVAWSFTLLHELVHLWLGETGISNNATDSKIEQFCNEVAGEFMLPTHELEDPRFVDIKDHEDFVDIITAFANERNISRSMVAYKLYRLQLIPHEIWKRLDIRFKDARSEERKEKRANESDQGPDYYKVRRSQVGDALINVVQRMMSAGAFTTTKAGTVLGVRAKNVQNLLGVANASRAA